MRGLIASCHANLRGGGVVVLVGAFARPVELDVASVLIREVRLKTSFACCGDFSSVIELLARGAPPSPVYAFSGQRWPVRQQMPVLLRRYDGGRVARRRGLW